MPHGIIPLSIDKPAQPSTPDPNWASGDDLINIIDRWLLVAALNSNIIEANMFKCFEQHDILFVQEAITKASNPIHVILFV
jgi:hypothetical protein